MRLRAGRTPGPALAPAARTETSPMSRRALKLCNPVTGWMEAPALSSVMAFLGAVGRQTGLKASPAHYQALPLTVWCEVTNASMWITEFLAFYNQVSATVSTPTSAQLAGPWSGRREFMWRSCACEWACMFILRVIQTGRLPCRLE